MTKNKIKKTNKNIANNTGSQINSSAPRNQIEIYQNKDNKTEIEVQFDNETFWLSQSQIGDLFERDRSVITKHIKKVFAEGELEENSNVQKMHIPNSDKPITLYSLDLIISVGYRVNSKQGTRFRIWATERLRDYLVKGFAINEKRVKEYQENLIELRKTIKLIQDSVELKELSTLESKGFLDIITNYTQSFILLNRFDSATH